ncbi:MAG: ribose-5-phosphate isomerase RpiA [Bacteroidales bacterium]|jgi:ribose 5-phosphate isomerase A|nr:ribose-5-phosphate isomerase RpiA [Bacteroidales bacterium]
MNVKQIIGEKAAEYIRSGMILGLGTGSTAFWAIRKIGQMVRDDGLDIVGVPTSEGTKELALDEGIPLIPYDGLTHIDLTIDGADEFALDKNLIKGGGGALLREKIVASLSDYYIVIADHAKLSPVLGKFPLPVEVIPFAWQVTSRHIERLGCQPHIRGGGKTPFITDNGNYILDCDFGKITEPNRLSQELNRIPGVVENGLFLNMTDIIITSTDEGGIRIIE